MATVNEDLQHAAIDHSIDLIRYQNGVVRKIIALLNRTDKDLFEQLAAALQRLPAEAFTVERLDNMLQSVRTLNARAYEQVRQGLEQDLRELVIYEAGYQQQLFQNTVPVNFQVNAVNVAQVYSAVTNNPFQGRVLSEWIAGLEAGKATKIRDALRIGYVEGQTIDEMTRRIRGTKARQYQDGIIEITRRDAETVVRTAISHTANHTRQKFYEANNDLVKGIKWISTLDSRTSPICQARDGQIYPVDSGPRPPAHPNCRSSTTPVLKSWKELGIDLEELPTSTRASMDGQVSADITYNEWLKKKSPEFQDKVLGTTKGKLFRAGMPVDRFVNKAGDVLSLDELRKRDLDFFKKAGLVEGMRKPAFNLSGVNVSGGYTADQYEQALSKMNHDALAVAAKQEKPSIIRSENKAGRYTASTRELVAPLDYNMTLFHEYGHHIDNVGSNLKSIAISQHDTGFQSAFYADRKLNGLHSSKTMNSALQSFRDEYFTAETVTKRSYSINKEVEKVPGAGLIADIYDAMTRGGYMNNYGIGHGSAYYKDAVMRHSETFANLYALKSTDLWPTVRKSFPSLASRFDEILDSLK